MDVLDEMGNGELDDIPDVLFGTYPLVLDLLPENTAYEVPSISPITGRLGENLSVEQGREAVRIAAMNALAVAQQHLCDLDRLMKLVKLSVVLVTTEQFVEHAAVAEDASNLFVQLFGAENGHVRTVYGVQSLPIGTPVIVEVILEIK